MSFVTRFGIDFAERGWLPDGLLQWGIRQLIAKRQQTLLSNDCEQVRQLEQTFIAGMDNSVIAALPSKANEQHYELPVEFFDHILGRHRKYSCCWWPDHVQSLDAAEQAALEITCSRAGIREGARVLELGCGWGSLTLWMAQHYATASITAVSNSHSQRQFILSEVARLDLSNVQIVTADINHFQDQPTFRPRSIRRNVRAHAKLPETLQSHLRLVITWWAILPAHFLPQNTALCIYRRDDRRLDGATLL